MTRREFGLAALVAPFFGRAASSPQTFGRLTVRGWLVHKNRTGKEIRVYVEGRDVTRDCKMANDRKGLAIIHLRNEKGQFYIGPDGRAARRLYRGPVQMVEVAAS
jgi:hypothetical protein